MLAVTGLSASCDDGFYPADNVDGDEICYECSGASAGIIKCDDAGVPEEYDAGIEGTDDTGLAGLCPTGTLAGDFYWMEDNCVNECKEGCSDCNIDYDFCIDCESGYVWNDDWTCLPSVIGLLATTLVLLVVGVVFIVISFMKVNAAAK